MLKKIKPYLIINKINTFVIFFLFSFSALSAGGGDDDKKDTSVKSAYYYKAVKLIKKNSFNLAIENLLKAEQILKSKRGRPTPDLKVLEDLINN